MMLVPNPLTKEDKQSSVEITDEIALDEGRPIPSF